MVIENIYIIGLGGIGSAIIGPISKFLRFYSKLSPVIYLIDGDTVEDSNLTRQAFIKGDINKNKAIVMKEYMQTIVENEINAIGDFLTDNNIDIIKTNSIIFVAVDNFYARYLVERHCLTLQNALVIFGGNDYDDGDVNIFEMCNGKPTTPLYSEKHPEIKTGKPKSEISCAEAAVSAPQLILANITAATLMLNSLYTFLNKGVTTNQIYFDTKTNKIICE